MCYEHVSSEHVPALIRCTEETQLGRNGIIRLQLQSGYYHSITISC